MLAATSTNDLILLNINSVYSLYILYALNI